MNRLAAIAVCAWVGSCACPGPTKTHASASREQYAAQIDACFAMDVDCEALCRAALALPMEDIVTTCEVTSADDAGVDLDVVYVTPCGPD